METRTTSSTDVRFVAGRATHAAGLPDAAGVQPHVAPFLDRVGDAVREQPWLPIGGGGVAATLLGARSIRAGAGPLRVAGAIAGGLVAGAMTSLIAGASIRGLLDRHDAEPAATHARAAAASTVVADERLRVMTFNLHAGMGPEHAFGSSDAELDRIADAIRRAEPDVVLLQEVDHDSVRSNFRDTLAELSSRLHPDAAVVTARGTMATGRQEGTGLMTFHGVEVADARGIVSEDPYGSDVVRRARTWVTGGIRGFRDAVLHQQVSQSGMPDYFPRVTTDAMLVTPAGNHVRVMGGHYNGPTEQTDYQAAQVEPVSELVDDWDGPTLWAADWNVRSDTPAGARERAIMERAGLRDSFTDIGAAPGDPRRRSFGDTPRSDLDRIYVSPEFGVDSVEVEGYPDGQPAASDHHPLVADLRLQADGDSPGATHG